MVISADGILQNSIRTHNAYGRTASASMRSKFSNTKFSKLANTVVYAYSRTLLNFARSVRRGGERSLRGERSRKENFALAGPGT